MLKLKPWYTPPNLLSLDRTITIIFISLTLFLLVYNISVGGKFEDIYRQQSVIIFNLFLLVISYFSIGTKAYGGFGTETRGAIGILLGCIVGGIAAIVMSFKLSVPMAVTLSVSGIISALYIALVVPFVEEKFFGRILPFALNSTLNAPLFVAIITSLIFGFFHYFIYRADYLLIVSAIVFRFCVLIMNEILQTGLFGDTMHYINNIMAVIRGS